MKLPKPRQKDNGKWIIQVQIDKKRVSKEFETESEALYWAAGIKTEAIKTEPQKKKTLTLENVFDQYLKQRANILSPSTLRAYQNVRDNYFPDIMEMPVEEVNKSVVQEEINKLAAEKSYKTIKNAVALLLSVIQDYNSINIKRLTFPQKEDKEHSFLEAPDIARLIDAVRDDPVEIPVLLALWLGLRRSEICALEWSDFDFKKKTVSVTKAMIPGADGFVVRKQTKTTKSKRSLNVPDYVISRLNALQSNPKLRVGRIVTMHPNDIYNHLKVICDNNEIPFVGVHGLRHTNASVMLSIGITTKMAMARGGWSSNKTMQDIYQHLFSEDKDKAASQIDEYFDKLIGATK
jgi:integrase